MAEKIRSMTRQRRVILQELQKVTTHPTADQVYDMVRKKLPRISLATVYRNLDLLAQDGLISKLDGGAQLRFDGNPADHYHIRCTRCQRVDDYRRAVMVKDKGGENRYRIAAFI